MKIEASDGGIKQTLITFDIVVEFDSSGQPNSKSVFGHEFVGTKEEFKKQFNN